jgi:uncharacterized membrane protein YhaH (DUF805 family)
MNLGIPEQIAILLVAAAIWLPWVRIFSKAGYSAWLSLLMFVPPINFAVLVWFAFSDWTALRGDTPSNTFNGEA